MSVIEETSTPRHSLGNADLPERPLIRTDSLGRTSSAPTKIEEHHSNSVTQPQCDRHRFSISSTISSWHSRDTSEPPQRVRPPPPSTPARNRSLSTSSVGAHPTHPQGRPVHPSSRNRSGSAAGAMRPAGAFRMQLATSSEQPELDAERADFVLPKNLGASPLDTPTELIRSANGALTALQEYMKSVDPILLGRQERKKLDDFVLKVIAGVRNLVYILATPVDRLPDERGQSRGSQPPSPTHGLRSYLQPYYWKIIAALSKLLQVNIIIQNNPSVSMGDSKMQSATSDLGLAVGNFVEKFQRYQDQHRDSPTSTDVKRLFGGFQSPCVDPSARGRPAAGWRGPLASRSDKPFKKNLEKEVIVELKGTVGTIEHKLLGLVTGSGNTSHKAGRHSILA